ncbi:MAG TPA: UDP-3-O-(3-hydroxymyristoyl)glucosamine N-acyltransferase [Chthoniobacteraceae bacterium]|nr:UDP-3-O-(3-hydroxymyristoyl)glucosamine N-acyltransferase [Chthoniobacteraceae bacterium]
MEAPGEALSVDQIATLVGGTVLPSSGLPPSDRPDRTEAQETQAWITGAASIADAGPQEVTFFGNARYLPQLKGSRAGCVLVPRGFAEPLAAALVEVDNPTVAFSTVLAHFAPPEYRPEPGIDPTAVIGQGVTLGEGVFIGPYAVIEEGATIGARTVIGAHALVGRHATIGSDSHLHPRVTLCHRCRLGDRVIIHSGTVVGSDGFGYELVEGRHVKIPQTGIVQIDNDVEIGANTTIDRARFGRTWIGEGTKIDNLVQIAHNVVIGRHCIIVSQVGISGSSRLGDYVTLAGQVGIVGHIEIGSQAVVAAQGGVSKSIPARQVWWGSPAGPIREEKEKVALINRLPKFRDRLKQLEERFTDRA